MFLTNTDNEWMIVNDLAHYTNLNVALPWLPAIKV